MQRGFKARMKYFTGDLWDPGKCLDVLCSLPKSTCPRKKIRSNLSTCVWMFFLRRAFPFFLFFHPIMGLFLVNVELLGLVVSWTLTIDIVPWVCTIYFVYDEMISSISILKKKNIEVVFFAMRKRVLTSSLLSPVWFDTICSI